MGRWADVSRSASDELDTGQRARHVEVTGHDGERLLEAVLPGPEPLHGGVGECVAGQVVPAEALDGQRSARAERRLGGGDGRVRASRPDRSGPVLQPQARAAVGMQAIGCAWKRRSAGSWYSEAQASHSANPRIVVLGRS